MKITGHAKWKPALLLSALMFVGTWAGSAQIYNVGDAVDEFELVNRTTWFRDSGERVDPGDPLKLSDFSGKIVLLEWFAYW